MSGTFTYRTESFRRTLDSCKYTRDVSVAGPGRVRAERDQGYPAVTVAPIATVRVEVATVERVFADGVPDVIVLVPDECHYDWDARMFAEDNGSSVQTVKEIFTSLGYEDPRPFVHGPIAYCVTALRGHSIVRAVEMICESKARVLRYDRRDVVISIEQHVYEFSEEAVVHAIARHPGIDAILHSSLNGTPTGAARRYASEAGVGLFGLGDLMGTLHLE